MKNVHFKAERGGTLIGKHQSFIAEEMKGLQRGAMFPL